ncbi:L-psp endoribonuclease family protein [Microdochium trichocladiopsis]|uniref:L-psp endoribonuclease family protein n=1 Tax=Microdochium trichocladiopsis TaxID=1682393 RepID=A0A9P9BL41_9PEZI|nr:L-psp endoribonuclease family protein [Microdochium trichocladiopsis]KAH7024504.1 L-psp endoribonuclease family protein [Microdochium trichocladiopsis]
MSREAVKTTNAPTPPPGLSQAIRYNGMVYCSGNIGSDLNGTLVTGGVKEETRAALQHLSAVLEAAGSSLANAVKVNVFLTTMDDFTAMHEAYNEAFAHVDPKPVRTAVAVYQLPRGAKVEIECSAALNPSHKL